MTQIPKTLLVSELYWPEEGGSVRWFANVLDRLPAGSAGVLTNTAPGRTRTDRVGRVRVHRRRMPWRDSLKPFDFIEICASLCRHSEQLCKREGYEILQCARVFPEGLAGWFCQRRLGRPYAVYVHGEEVARYRNYRIERHLLPIIFSGACLVIANSANSARLAVDAGAAPGRVQIVHPGVDPERFAPDTSADPARKALGLTGRRVVLTVGRLTERKGQDRVIEAVGRLAAEMPELLYLIVGRGEDEPRLRDLVARLGLVDRVVFAGLVDDDLLPSCYAASDVVVMPNRELGDGDIEGFGIVFIEAAACAKPAIGGCSGGAAEAIVDGQTGLVIDPDEPGALDRALGRLLRDADLARSMGRAGRRRVEAEFGWAKIAQRIGAFLGAACQAGPRPGRSTIT